MRLGSAFKRAWTFAASPRLAASISSSLLAPFLWHPVEILIQHNAATETTVRYALGERPKRLMSATLLPKVRWTPGEYSLAAGDECSIPRIGTTGRVKPFCSGGWYTNWRNIPVTLTL